MADRRPLILIGGDIGRGDTVDYRERLASEFSGARFVSYDEDREVLREMVGEAEAVIGHVPDSLLPSANRLRWVQTTGAGADGVCSAAYRDRPDVVATNASGVHVASAPEQVLAMLFAFARCLPEQVRNQAGERRRYWPQPPFEVEGQTMGVVGLGRIGRALAQKARGVGMSVIGSSRSGSAAEAAADVERVYGPEDLEELLAASDHVVITVPLTRETRGLIGARELAAMKPTAYLYNVGRGPVVGTDALVAALQEGRIAGAGLDVTDPEPLPPDHALWTAPNTIILTHYAGLTPRYGARAYAIVRENVGRFLAGEPLLNVVDKERGY